MAGPLGRNGVPPEPVRPVDLGRTGGRCRALVQNPPGVPRCSYDGKAWNNQIDSPSKFGDKSITTSPRRRLDCTTAVRPNNVAITQHAHDPK